MSKYRKFIAALAGVAGVLTTVLADGIVASDEYESVIFALVSAVAVFWLRNEPATPLALSRNVGG